MRSVQATAHQTSTQLSRWGVLLVAQLHDSSGRSLCVVPSSISNYRSSSPACWYALMFRSNHLETQKSCCRLSILLMCCCVACAVATDAAAAAVRHWRSHYSVQKHSSSQLPIRQQYASEPLRSCGASSLAVWAVRACVRANICATVAAVAAPAGCRHVVSAVAKH